jgi:hypothetical protein
MVGIVIARARHRAKIRAKSLIVSEKTFFNHRAPMQWNGSFRPKISPIFASRFDGSIRYSRSKHDVLFYLRNRTTAHHTEYLMGCTVNNLLKLWVCELSFLKRHPSNQKVKNVKYRALIGTKWIFGTLLYQPASPINILRDEESSGWKPKYGIELPTSTRIIRVVLLKNWAIFKYINSLLAKRHMIQIFSKKHVQDTRW